MVLKELRREVEMSTVEFRKLKALGRQIDQELGVAPRDLELLDEIEKTVAKMEVQTSKFQGMVLQAENFVDQIQKGIPEDASNLDEVAEMFEKTRDVVADFYALNAIKRQSAVDDDRLTADDCVVDCYDSLLDTLASLHNSLNSIAFLIGEHIAEADTLAPGEFNSADELFVAMGV